MMHGRKNIKVPQGQIFIELRYLFILVTYYVIKAAHKYFRQVFLSLRCNKGIVLIIRDLSKLPTFHCDDGINPKEFKVGWRE